jgi:hypothetical protein
VRTVAPVTKELAALEAAQAAQAEALRTSVEELRRSFLVHEWRYARKK